MTAPRDTLWTRLLRRIARGRNVRRTMRPRRPSLLAVHLAQLNR